MAKLKAVNHIAYLIDVRESIVHPGYGNLLQNNLLWRWKSARGRHILRR